MERYWQNGVGLIEVICGPMFSGKTEELIRRLRRVEIARLRALVFKPLVDDRYNKTQVVSHSAQSIPSIAVENVAAMHTHWETLDRQVSVIGIDEVQFFGPELLDFVEKLAGSGTRVVLAGLDQDYLGEPFGVMPNLLAIADLVTKQHAVCMACGAPASKSQRVKARSSTGSEPQILVGAADAYEARCRRCFVPKVDEATR